MPGLIRGVARTAAIAGTATAVSNRVSRRQAGRWQEQEQQQYAQEAQYAPPPPPPPPPAVDMESKLAQLKELGELKEAGVLNDYEFEHSRSSTLSGQRWKWRVAPRRVRRPSIKARGARILAICERRATPSDGMHRPSNAAALPPRAASFPGGGRGA